MVENTFRETFSLILKPKFISSAKQQSIDIDREGCTEELRTLYSMLHLTVNYVHMTRKNVDVSGRRQGVKGMRT